MSRFGRFLDHKCAERFITHTKFEEMADIGYGITSKYIYGQRIPQSVTLLKIMITLNLSDEEVLEMMEALKQDAIERGDINLDITHS